MNDLAAIRDQLRLLSRRHIDNPSRDLKPDCLAVIDGLATFVSGERGELPQSIAQLLHTAMIAAMRADVATVIEQVEYALTEAARPLPRKLNPRTGVKSPSPKKVRPSTRQVVTAKPVAETIDPLLAKLRSKRPGSR